MEIITGSSNDTVTRPVLANGAVFRSDDVIKTNAGNDIINPGLGKDDTVYGGDGIDHLTLDYSVGDTGGRMYFNAGTSFGSAYRAVSSTNSTRLDSIFFSGIEQFTVTGTSKDDSITTSAGNDIINAGAGNDTISGGAGRDFLTGGTGRDTFKYRNSSDSLLAGFDVIKDFAIGSDVIDWSRSVAASQVKEIGGSVTALTETAIKQVLNSTNFSANGASTFSFGTRTFLGLNDGTAGFSARTDSIIEITGFSGSLTNLAII